MKKRRFILMSVNEPLNDSLMPSSSSTFILCGKLLFSSFFHFTCLFAGFCMKFYGKNSIRDRRKFSSKFFRYLNNPLNDFILSRHVEKLSEIFLHHFHLLVTCAYNDINIINQKFCCKFFTRSFRLCLTINHHEFIFFLYDVGCPLKCEESLMKKLWQNSLNSFCLD